MGHVEDRWYRKDGTPKPRCGKGARYRLRPTVDGREGPNESFERKGDANRQKIQLEADLLRGQWVDRRDQTALGAFSRGWVATRPHRPATARRMSSLIECHIVGTPLGDRRLASVRPSEVQAWVADRAKGLAPSTLRYLVSILRSIFAAAVLDKLVAASPVVRVTLPSTHRARIVPLTVEQVHALAAAVPAPTRAMVLTQAGLGLRLGELLALRVSDCDFLRQTVRVEHQIMAGSKLRSEPKTPRSRRTVPLPTVVAEALARHIEAFPPADDGTLFHTRSGAPYTHSHYGTGVFAPAVRRAGLPAGTTSHDLRHAYVSWLLAAGESVVAVAERLGHQNGALVLSTYAHLLPDSEDRTRRAIDGAWSSVSGESATAQGRPR